MLIVVNAYMEAKLLPLMLGSVPDGVDVVIVDGAYEDFPHGTPFSDDGSLELAEDWGAKIVRCTKAWDDQIAKRTHCLEQGDVVFIVDADEIIRGWDELPDDADVGWVVIKSTLYDEPYLEPRVFRVREGWHYAGRHHWIYDKDEKLVASHNKEGEGYRHHNLQVALENHREWRLPSRHRQKNEYAKARNVEELQVRHEGAVYPRQARNR